MTTEPNRILRNKYIFLMHSIMTPVLRNPQNFQAKNFDPHDVMREVTPLSTFVELQW
jgi:hypothetical protein